MAASTANVLSVTVAPSHSFSKPAVSSIKLIANYGVEGDCHAGKAVQHRSQLHIKPPPANLRQVHLIPIEILRRVSSTVSTAERTKLLTPGALGQNITTEGIDLLSLSVGTELRFVAPTANTNTAAGPILVLTGVRNPGPQIDRFQSGLQERFLVRDANRQITGRLAGVMTTVKQGGEVKPGMKIVAVKPSKHVPLGPV
ncbi:PK beta-barrel-protein domain-containing protein-like protein [Aspergillus varians]